MSRACSEKLSVKLGAADDAVRGGLAEAVPARLVNRLDDNI
jgi:hypothetical protein